ncbi:MAG: hypothetical protein SFV81_08660 [Pirellulaceae bacterium]|nr:hypothetical protein [Pirellulaceae bacterium]
MLLSQSSLPPKREDAFTSVAIAACINTLYTLQIKTLKPSSAALKFNIANTIASSTGLMVIADPQIAH